MSYNSPYLTTPTITGLVQSGSDLMQNMYDATIYFPTQSGKWGSDSNFKAYPLTVRLTSFDVPDIETSTYPIKYHGMTIQRPKTEITLERKLDLEFREDSAFDLRRRFTAWHAVISDPVTGGISNSILYYGKIIVSTLAGTYSAAQVVNPYYHDHKSDHGREKDIFTENGEIRTDNDMASEYNPIARWVFYNVWVYKVGGVKFSTEGADANKFTVSFGFMDVDFPQYGMNSLPISDEMPDIPENLDSNSSLMQKYRGNIQWGDGKVGQDKSITTHAYIAQSSSQGGAFDAAR